jgi:hypothetical protein
VPEDGVVDLGGGSRRGRGRDWLVRGRVHDWVWSGFKFLLTGASMARRRESGVVRVEGFLQIFVRLEGFWVIFFEWEWTRGKSEI